jgi:hypothetical protein
LLAQAHANRPIGNRGDAGAFAVRADARGGSRPDGRIRRTASEEITALGRLLIGRYGMVPRAVELLARDVDRLDLFVSALHAFRLEIAGVVYARIVQEEVVYIRSVNQRLCDRIQEHSRIILTPRYAEYRKWVESKRITTVAYKPPLIAWPLDCRPPRSGSRIDCRVPSEICGTDWIRAAGQNGRCHG